DLASFRTRLSHDPEIAAALEDAAKADAPKDTMALCLALWQNHGEAMAKCAAPALAFVEKIAAEVSVGGYERLIIFDGRTA
ncbi:MAG: hypothetical protein N3A66_08430, partial [Planctomycetota bacterium]|nr:hypothetical protein [Planctomycetota bacterium]